MTYGEDEKSGRGRKPQMSPEAREAAILDAAERVLTREGLRGASMAAIAAEAGMSKRTLYGLFDSRDALLAACVRRLRRALLHPLGPEADGLPLEERLFRLLVPDPGFSASPVPREILRAVIAEAPHQPAMALAFLEEGPRMVHRLIREELERAAAAGEIALEDPGFAAALLHDMAYDGLLEKLVAPDAPAPPPDRAAARLRAAIAVFLCGISGAAGR